MKLNMCFFAVFAFFVIEGASSSSSSQMPAKTSQEVYAIITKCKREGGSFYKHGDTLSEEIDTYCKSGGDPNIPAKFNRQLLAHYAVEVDDSRAIEMLDKYGADLNCKDRDGQAPLHIAVAESGRLKALKALLACKNAVVDPNIKNAAGNTPLHLAACLDRERSIEALLDCEKVALDVRDSEGRTALHVAAYYAKEEALLMLLKKGAKKCIAMKDNEGRTPLHCAASNGVEVIHHLLNNFDRNKEIINMRDNEGSTALHLLISLAAYLIEQGFCPSGGLRALLEWGADVNAQNTRNGRTALLWLVRMTEGSKLKKAKQIKMGKAIELAEILLKYGADPAIKDGKNRSAIDWAKSLDFDDILKLFESSVN